ncbi:MAG TPA: hypothetical protein ENH54_03635, partial [Actinobacteria bacterium]|nr:hypothetical protein [Actinomycetota bacterium]
MNAGCRLVWLDPMPLEEDIYRAYENYFTHTGTSAGRWIETAEQSQSRRRRFYLLVRKEYWKQRFGYFPEAAGGWKRVFGLLVYLHPAWRSAFDAGVMFLDAHPGGKLLEIGSGG